MLEKTSSVVIISPFIVFCAQVSCHLVPSLVKLRKEGIDGNEKIKKYTLVPYPYSFLFVAIYMPSLRIKVITTAVSSSTDRVSVSLQLVASLWSCRLGIAGNCYTFNPVLYLCCSEQV